MPDGHVPGSSRIVAAARATGAAGAARVETLIDRPTRRRAGVFRRALRREISRLRDRERLLAIVLLALVAGIAAAGLLARGEAAGADARAYWAAVRIWLGGGDPYHPTGPFMPYVYSPWLLPLFGPWALMPWDVAWFVWRGGTVLALLWSIHWAYRRRPLATAVVTTIMAAPLVVNLDTGNITLILALLVWGAQFLGPRTGGALWALATTMKWIPAPLWLLLEPRARAWGLVWLLVAAILTVATLPATLVQLQVLFAFSRPVRIDYLVLAWAAIPWLWRHPDPLWFARPATWSRTGRTARQGAETWATRMRSDPADALAAARVNLTIHARTFLGIGSTGEAP